MTATMNATLAAYDYARRDLLNNRTKRKVGYALYARLTDADAVAVRYHDTDIVTFYSDGSIYLDNGGWPSMTTKRKMNELLAPLGLCVDGYTLHRGTRPKTADKRPWLVRRGVRTREGEVVARFVGLDSDVYVMNPWNTYFLESPVTGAPGWGSNDGTCERMIASVPSGLVGGE